MVISGIIIVKTGYKLLVISGIIIVKTGYKLLFLSCYFCWIAMVYDGCTTVVAMAIIMVNDEFMLH